MKKKVTVVTILTLLIVGIIAIFMLNLPQLHRLTESKTERSSIAASVKASASQSAVTQQTISSFNQQAVQNNFYVQTGTQKDGQPVLKQATEKELSNLEQDKHFTHMTISQLPYQGKMVQVIIPQ
jgi:FtsZ-interacting cell division protein ZipA